MSMALESMNEVEGAVYMIPALEVEDEIQDSECKRQRVESKATVHGIVEDIWESNETLVQVVEVLEFPKVDCSEQEQEQL